MAIPMMMLLFTIAQLVVFRTSPSLDQILHIVSIKFCPIMQAPSHLHKKVLKRILGSLNDTNIMEFILLFLCLSLFLVIVTLIGVMTEVLLRGITGFLEVSSWSSRKQILVSRSSTEAEDRSLANVTAELILHGSNPFCLCCISSHRAHLVCGATI